MLPTCEEDVNGGRRGRCKRSARHSYNKGKGKGKEVRFAAESDGESGEDSSKTDEADEGDESSGSEGDC